RRRASGQRRSARPCRCWCLASSRVWRYRCWACCCWRLGCMAGFRTCAMADETPVVNRRHFLGRLSLALSGLAAAVVSVPIVAYLLSPLLHPPLEEWRDLGLVDNFNIGETVEVA